MIDSPAEETAGHIPLFPNTLSDGGEVQDPFLQKFAGAGVFDKFWEQHGIVGLGVMWIS